MVRSSQDISVEYVYKMANRSRLGVSDPCSFSTPEDFLVRHIELDISVNFPESTLSGNVILDVEKKNASAEILVNM